MTLDTPSLGEMLERIRVGLCIAAGWASRKPDSGNARDKIKAALDATRELKALFSRLPEAREYEGRLPEPSHLMTREEFRTLNIAGPFRVDLNYDGFGNVAVWLSAQPIHKSEVK